MLEADSGTWSLCHMRSGEPEPRDKVSSAAQADTEAPLGGGRRWGERQAGGESGEAGRSGLKEE